MGSGMSGLGGFARGFQQGYSFVTDEQKKAQEAEAREMQLEDEKAIRKAYKAMPDFQNYQRPIYRAGVTPPGKDFVGPPDPSQDNIAAIGRAGVDRRIECGTPQPRTGSGIERCHIAGGIGPIHTARIEQWRQLQEITIPPFAEAYHPVRLHR